MTLECAAADFLCAYQTGMRSSLFTGFLTLCGFLMSAKTFIVVNMKKEVYDQDSYLLTFDLQRKLDKKLTLYGPLKNLSDSLLGNVWFALVTSVLQFSLGFVPYWQAAAACVLAALVSVIYLGLSLLRIRSNLREMFRRLDGEAEAKIAAAKQRAAKAAQG